MGSIFICGDLRHLWFAAEGKGCDKAQRSGARRCVVADSSWSAKGGLGISVVVEHEHEPEASGVVLSGCLQRHAEGLLPFFEH